MGKGLFFRLAKENLIRNKRMYIPYAAATVIMSSMFFIITNIVFSKSVSHMSYGGVMKALLIFGIIVMSFFTVIYMLYINSFLIKRRKQEFGLYAVLGLEKRHVGFIILWESIFLNAATLGFGLLSGIVFGKLAFMLLMKILRTAPDSVYLLSPLAFLITILMFSVIFTATTLYNLLQVRLANPAELLVGKKKGEKKVKGVIPLTILGLILLSAAYYLAVTVKVSGIALALFWPCVILVISATLILFNTGSVFILNSLKRNKKFYYKPGNFIAVSGLAHRLKQNASGLHNICILSTMVLVTVSSCCALYFGQEEILKIKNPNDIVISVSNDESSITAENQSKALSSVDNLASEYNVTIEDFYGYHFLSDRIVIKDGEFILKDENGNLNKASDYNYEDYYDIEIITAETFNAVTGKNENLADNELIFLTNDDIGTHTVFKAGGSTYNIRRIEYGNKFIQGKNSGLSEHLFIVVSDNNAANKLINEINPGLRTDPEINDIERNLTAVINISGKSEDCTAFSKALPGIYTNALLDNPEDGYGYTLSNIFTNREEGYGLYGGLLFIGIFFTVLFLTNTVLIIYFKQISEGFDDMENFRILQKVGMSDEEVKSTINKQILIVFFLPLAVALMHVAFASNMIVRVLEVLMLHNSGLTMLCIAVTSIVFAAAYVCVYRITAGSYYRLVRRDL